ncbi:MAG: chromosomal replication initiator protein DnaA [Melioribacteraceae bacterium]|nr:chromosomal replication initiator protein DnaA [Melioribacteraceae bacterium]MCF8356708.1 chromosomal replication initiator protein DnaA [Melioribacteraceae bacterium]MCF8396092.1 chromosomal replication initiator protein DnaA [Melioribacteraceae bacterium]MCF8421078.1 chromosomal replication initiator protein DnaA [Melioribacteraceae bacterium]
MKNNIVELATYTDPKIVWKEFLKGIKEKVPFITYNTWFIPIKPLELENDTLKIQVPNNFFIEWIDEHYNSLINSLIENILGENGKLIYVIFDDFDQYEIVRDSNETIKEEPVPEVKPAVDNSQDFESNINPRYKFDNFIKGEGNQLARAASVAIAENPGQTSFNPLFLYGGVGLGKTHLIQAIGNQILSSYPQKKVIYLSSDIFTVEFVEAIQSNTVNDFSNFYKGMDVLIIDDIQFLIGKEKTQDLFFHIFNTLHQSGKQIILSSDKPPKDLKGLNERLISRFQWGLTADVQPPDFETRIAILKNKGESYGIILNNQLLEYIAYNITSNIRELEGCLIKLLANASLNSKEIDLELVKKTVKEISTNRPLNISIEYITKTVCEYYSVDENKVREKNRKKEVVNARQIAMYLSKQLTKSSLKTIGLHFGGRDHSTVIHAFNTIENLVNKDPGLKENIDTIRSKIEFSAG